MTGTARGGEWVLGGDLDLAAVGRSLAKDISVVGALLRATSGVLASSVEVTWSFPLSRSDSWSKVVFSVPTFSV